MIEESNIENIIITIMKFNSFKLMIILGSFLSGNPMADEDTVIIHPINWKTPSPEGWNAQYEKDIYFPKQGPWSKIIMVQTLKCDSATRGDSYPCGEWDYIWNTLITVQDKDSSEIFSIGSFGE